MVSCPWGYFYQNLSSSNVAFSFPFLSSITQILKISFYLACPGWVLWELSSSAYPPSCMSLAVTSMWRGAEVRTTQMLSRFGFSPFLSSLPQPSSPYIITNHSRHLSVSAMGVCLILKTKTNLTSPPSLVKPSSSFVTQDEKCEMTSVARAAAVWKQFENQTRSHISSITSSVTQDVRGQVSQEQQVFFSETEQSISPMLHIFQYLYLFI